VGVAAGVLAVSPIADRARATVLSGQGGVEQRLSIYRAALAAFERRPVFGYGPDSFSIAYPANRDDKSALLLQKLQYSSGHSWVFQALATTGAVGFVSLLAVIVTAFWILWTEGKRRQGWLAGPLLMGLAAYLGHGLVTVGAVGVDWFPWLAFGAAAGISGERAEVIPRLRGVPRLATIAVGAAATVAALSGLIALSAGEEAWQARLLVLRQSTAALEHAERAVRLDPGRGEYWNWLGQARDIANDRRGASDAYGEATRRQPYNPKFWGDLARNLARQANEGDLSKGGGPAAIAAARRGAEADPNGPDANAVLAEIANQFGQGDLALSAAVRAVVLYPIEPAYDVLTRRAARGASDLQSAAAALDRALGAKDSAPLRVAAAEIAVRLGDLAAAKAHAARAAQLAPDDPEVKRLLAQLSGS
jgi:Flp pilus assembly protein TadD